MNLLTDNALTNLMAIVGTGFAGTMQNMPAGWAQVTYFPYAGSDTTGDYTGPVKEDNDDFIVLSVFDSNMTFPKSRVIVTYP
jgi:hypothetical protein